MIEFVDAMEAMLCGTLTFLVIVYVMYAVRDYRKS